jgi:hypothetical protein
MGVQPPAGDDEVAEETGVDFGIAAVDARLSGSDVTFPATGRAVVRALGDPSIPYAPGGNTVPLSEVVERTETEQFETRQEFLNALHPVFEELRTSRGSGVVGWLRSLIPGR